MKLWVCHHHIFHSLIQKFALEFIGSIINFGVMSSERLVVADLNAKNADFGVLQRGFEYALSIPLVLSGTKADPTRYRVIEQPQKSQNKAHYLLRCASGATGRLSAGIPVPLEIVIEAYQPGIVDSEVVISSEGGESSFRVLGHVLDGATYRSFSRTKMQLSNERLSRKGVCKLGPTSSDKHGGPLAEAFGPPTAASESGSLLSQLSTGATPPTATAGDHLASVDEFGLPLCPEADAVERLLSQDEVDELSSFPTVPVSLCT